MYIQTNQINPQQHQSTDTCSAGIVSVNNRCPLESKLEVNRFRHGGTLPGTMLLFGSQRH